MIENSKPWGFHDLMVTAAFRYCLGRRSYIVSVCVDWLIEQWPNFEENVKDAIQRDLEDELKRDDQARERGSTSRPLGDDCDRQEWKRVRQLWLN